MSAGVASDLLERLCTARGFGGAPSVVVVAAHPDDEVIGAGAQLRWWRDGLAVVHVTDGAPRDMGDARRAGFPTREGYAAARRAEALGALARAAVEKPVVHALGFVDQEASLDLAGLARTLARMLRDLRPEAVVTHPYEGGHPDHDATALAVHAAARLLGRAGAPSPAIVEMTSYHNAGGVLRAGEFLPADGAEVITLPLSPEGRRCKKGLLACFRTQAGVLQAFGVEVERFRLAPAYDFTAPPHDGRLWYECFDWGMTGERWRRLAGAALRELALGGPL